MMNVFVTFLNIYFFLLQLFKNVLFQTLKRFYLIFTQRFLHLGGFNSTVAIMCVYELCMVSQSVE